MLSDIQKMIVYKAIEIRITNGEKLDDIIASYPKLDETDIAEIKEIFQDN